MPQIQPRSSLQAKNVPWPENGASAVVEGRRPGRDWCRWRTVPGTYTGTGTHWQCLVPPCVPGDLECARFIASRASAILASSSMAARPNATKRQLISLFRAQALHPKHTGAAITLRVLGTKFSIPADSLQRRILLSRMDQFILLAKIHQWRLSTKPIIYFFLILYGNGGLKG